MTDRFHFQGVMLPVRDLDAALAFYRDVLGWALKFRDGASYAALDAGATSIALAARSEQPVEGEPALLVKVPDVPEALASLAEAGAKVLMPATDGKHEVRAAVQDAAGNVLSLYSPLKMATPEGRSK